MKRNLVRMVVEFRALNEPVKLGLAHQTEGGGWLILIDRPEEPPPGGKVALHIAPPGAVAWQKQQKTSRGRWLTEDEAREAPSDLVVWP